MKPDLPEGKHTSWVVLTAALVFSLGVAVRSYSVCLPVPSFDLSGKQQQTGSGGEQSGSAQSDQNPAPGTTPVAGDVPAATQGTEAVQKEEKGKDGKNAAIDPQKAIEVGSDRISVKPGSIHDVSAVGTRNIGGRGMGNWYSTESEIKMGKQYAMDIEKSTRFIADPVVTEYVNRIGQNIVKNSDCKVPFTIRVIDSDEVNAMALPGGFFYINSGLILSTDEEAEMAGVMAHEIAHVCAHHAARQMTRMDYTQLGMIPVVMLTGSGWAAFGIYEATQIAVPVAFLKFSRNFESEADYLGIQYAYRTGYDPQATITFFEKVQALEKRKPGAVSKTFSDHPQTPDRIVHSQEEIARILPPQAQYIVTTSEFDDVKARLARIQNKRRLIDPTKDKPSLRRKSAGSDSDTRETYDREDRPTLHPREDQEG
jgi:beta-barrel assembly-enhancing protease